MTPCAGVDLPSLADLSMFPKSQVRVAMHPDVPGTVSRSVEPLVAVGATTKTKESGIAQFFHEAPLDVPLRQL